MKAGLVALLSPAEGPGDPGKAEYGNSWFTIKSKPIGRLPCLDRVPCGSLPYLGTLETNQPLANLRRLITDYRAEGVIHHALRYCIPFTFKAI